jgi:shikimate kinase
MRNRDFSHVLWIGGSVCSGKTSAAKDLARRYGLRIYSFDLAEPFHIYRSVPERQPNLIRFMAMTMDERWVLRTPEAMAEHALAAWSEERFPMVLDDLRHLPGSGAVIAEGAGLLPEKVAPLLTDNRSALWLVATPECIRQVRTVRGEGVSQATSDPKRAFENLVARDVLMTEHIRLDADRLGLHVVSVDADSLPGISAIIERHFASHLPGVC